MEQKVEKGKYGGGEIKMFRLPREHEKMLFNVPTWIVRKIYIQGCF
jgi:hypothetical protein